MLSDIDLSDKPAQPDIASEVVPSPIALRKSLRVHDVFIFKPLTE